MSVVSEVVSEVSDITTDTTEEIRNEDLDETSFYSAQENLTICEDNEAEFSLDESHTVVEISQKCAGAGPGPRGEPPAPATGPATSLSLELAQPGPASGRAEYFVRKYVPLTKYMIYC